MEARCRAAIHLMRLGKSPLRNMSRFVTKLLVRPLDERLSNLLLSETSPLANL